MNKHASINRAFRLIWNEALGAWIPVAETARGRGKGSGRRAAALAILAAAGLSSPLYAAPPTPVAPPAPIRIAPIRIAPTGITPGATAPAATVPAVNALPTAGQVTAGAAVITTPSAAVLDIDQTSQRAVIDWNTFNVGSAAQVNFNQPNSSSATLNRVLDSNASQIFGKITATGEVFLSNPNGVYFGKSASVDVGSLTAMTGSIDDAAFMAGELTFARNGATGSVVNEGTLNARLGGYIALLAANVRNSGIVVAHMGTVAMSAGDSVTLNFDGGHLAGITTQPATLAALLANKTAVVAPGGIVILSAPALDRLQGSVVKAFNTTEATHLTASNGHVVLDTGTIEQTATGRIDVSGSSGGSVAVDGAQTIALAGSIDAHATGAGAGGTIAVTAAQNVLLHGATLDASSVYATGGAVSLTAATVGLSGTTAINASGATGGGAVRVGGGFHGQDSSLANAQNVSIGSAARIDASATGSGAGGTVAVWSDGNTQFGGNIAARGGVSGAGGFVEVSGRGTLDFAGHVDAHATHGAAGTLLLDPTNITVATGGSGLLAANPLTFGTNAGTDSTIDPGAITAVTNTGTAVSLQASNDLTINSTIQTSAGGAGGSMTFRAGRSIAVNASVISDNGNISFTANDSGANSTYRASGTATFTNSSVIDAGSGTVTIVMDSYAGLSGAIGTGHVAGANLVVTQNGPTAGATSGAIDLGQSDITGNLTITANSARNVTNTLGNTGNAGNVVVRGTTSVSVGTGSVSIAGPHTDFSIIGLTAGNVTLNDTNAVQFGTTNLSGTLTETTNGPIASTGSVQVAGLATLTANNGGFGIADPYINLNNASNHFGGGLVLSVPSIGTTGTGGYATIRDSGAITINSSNVATNLSVTAAGAIATAGADVAGTSVSLNTSSGGVTTGSTNTNYFTIGATGAVSLGASAVGVDFSVSTNGTITDGAGAITVGRQTTLTAGSANNISLTNANDDFSSLYIVTANNATVVDKNGINFGAYCGCGGYNTHVYGGLTLTAGGDITQTGQSGGDGYSAITVGGATTFTANNASSQINLYLGSTNPFSGNAGESNLFSGGVTLTRNNTNTGFSNVDLRDTNPSAVVLSGLTSVGTLSNVSLRFDNAQSVALPGMTVTNTLQVYAPSVGNTVNVPTNIISETGPIVVGGSTIIAAGSTGDIVLTNASNNFTQFGIANTGARNFSLVNSGAIVLYAPGYHQGVSNNYSVTAGGDITDVQYNLVVPGEATFNAGTHNVTLTGTNFYVNDLAIPAANNVNVYSQNSVVLDNINITGTLSLSSRGGGTLTQLASTSVVTGTPTTNTTTFNTYNSGITLNQSGNVFGKLAISNAGAINIRENDPITQASAWTTWGSAGNNTTRYPVALATSNDQAITLDQNNYFGDVTITQINSGASSAGAVLVRENSDSIYGMTEGSAWTVHGTTTLDSGSYSITLNNANNLFGPLQVIGATGSTGSTPVASSVTLYAKTGSGDAITDVGSTGAWATGTGVVKLVAYDSTGTTAGSGNITLTNAANVMGDLYIKGATVTITENDSITDGPSTSWDTAGDTGWVTTGATNLIVANPTGKSITLDNLTNNLGPVGINSTGTAGTLTSVLVTDNSDLTQLAVWNVGAAPVTLDARTHNIDLSTYSNVLGPVTINTANGSPTSVKLTENDAIAQGSVWNLTGVPVTLVAQNGNPITLTNSSNIMGNLTITGGAVSITENSAITQGGAWTTTGTTTLNVSASSGFGITLTNASNVLGPIAIAGTPNAVSITENDDITQASAWVQGTAPFTLNAGSHNIVLSQAGNVLGDLTLTAQNATINENDPNGITDGGAWTIPGTTTLTAGSANPIVLNANPASDLGTVSIVSAANADINDVNGIIFGASTIASGGTLTVTAGGAITQSGAITAPYLRLIGTGNATLTNASNNVGTFAAGFSGGDLSFTNGGNFAVGVLGGTSGVTIGAHNVALTSATGTITGLSNINASSTSLALVTGTALSLPQMTVAGAQTYTASTVSGTGITLNAGLNSTAAGAITFNSPVTLAAALTVQSTNSNINFSAALAGGTKQLTVNAGTGTVAFGGAVSALGSTADAGAALSLTSSGASFASTLSANNGLAITGPVIFNDTVTLANGNAASVFTGLVTLGKAGGMNLSGYNGMSFNGGVLLQNGATTINSNNSPLTFQGASVSGPYALTLNSGTAALNGLNLMGANLTSLNVTALSPTIPSGGVSIAGQQSYTATSGSSINLNGPVTSTAAGNITFNSPVSLAASAGVSSANSPVALAATVDGNHDLTVNAGTGTTTFTGAVGAVAPLGDGTGAAIILQSTGLTTFASTVQTRSGITAAGPVAFTGNVTLGNGDTGSVFTGLVTTGGTSGNTLSGYDGLTFSGGVALVGGPVSVASNGSTLAFGGAVTGTQALTLNALSAGAGTITGLDQIGFSSTLSSLSLTAQTLSLPSGGLAVAGPMTFTAAGGITVNGPVGNSAAPAAGQIDFNSPVTLATGAIGITTHNAAIDFNSTVNGAEALTVNSGTAAVNFGGAVGATIPLTSISTGALGTTAITGGSVYTSAAQGYNDAVTLGADTTLIGVNVQFAGTVNGAHALTVNDSGATLFNGIVGGSTPLTSVTTDAPGTVVVNTTAVTTSGAQTYNENMTLGADPTFSAVGITFGGTVDGAHALTANAGSGALHLNGAVGGGTSLVSLNASGNTVAAAAVTTTGAQTYSANSGVTLSGNLGTTGSNVTVTGPTTLGGDLTVASTGGNITFSGATSSINGAHSLTLTAGAGNVVLGGVVGGVTPLTALHVSGNDLTLPGISTVGDANQSYVALDNITLNQSRNVNAPIAFTADADGNGAGSFILLNGVSLTASNNTLSITAADIDLQGNSTLSSGSGVMTLTATNSRNIALGGSVAAGQMTISGSELSRMSSSAGLALDTTGAGWIHINGITTTQSQNITGTLSLNAQGTGDISFITAPSTFNALTTTASGGATNVGVNLSTTNDPIDFTTPMSVSGASTISSGGGNISFDAALSVDNDLTLSTSNGTLTFGGNVGSNKTLTLNLGGGAVNGLGKLQSTLTGLTVNATSGLTLPAFTINGPQVYNTGPITATGNLGGVGIAFNNLVDVEPASGSALTMNAGTGTLAFNNLASFNADDMTLIGDNVSFSRPITGSGNLVVQPFTSGRNIAVGGSGAPIVGLNLTSAALAQLPIGTLASLTIGSNAGTGWLDVAGVLNVSGTPLTLNGGGGITQSGGAVSSGPLALYAAGNAIALANGGNAFGAVALNGTPSAVSLTNTLNIGQLGSAAWNLGSAPVTLNAGTHDITLTNAGNTSGTLVLNGGNVQVTEASASDIGASAITKNLTVVSSGAISFSGALNATGNVSLTSTGTVTQSAPLTIGGNLSVLTSVAAGDVTVNNSAAAATSIGDTFVGGDYVLTATGEPVTQAAGASLQVAGNATVTGSSIVLGGAGNLIGGTTTLPATNTAVVTQSGVITLGNRNDAGSLTVVSSRTDRTIGSSPIHGTAINLNDAGNNIAGNIAVSASPPTINVSGADVQTGIVQAANTSISVSGVASFTAESSSAGSLGIDLTNTGNQFGTLLLSGNTVNVANSATGLTTIGNALATTSLTLATQGGITQTGAIISPTVSITANGPVTLNNAANDAGSLAATSAGNVISFVNSTGLVVAGIDAGSGSVSLTAGGGGGLTQTDALQHVAVLNVNAGAVTLNNSGNTITTLGASTAGTGFQVFDSTAMDVSGNVTSTAGNIAVRTSGDLTLDSGGRLLAPAGGIVASTEGAGNFFNASASMGSALVVGGTSRWLVYSDTPDLVSGTHTVKGGLASNFRHYGATYASYSPGAVTESGDGFIYSQAAGALTVSAVINGTPSQRYGSAPTATLGYSISAGLLDSEDSAANVVSGGTAAYSQALTNTMNAGTYSILYTGGLTSNYTLTPSATGATYSVTPATLTYTANSASRAYGAANPTLNGTIGGFVLGQTQGTILTGTAAWTTPATGTSDVGQYAINGSGYTLTGGNTNYTFAQAAGNATALTIGKAGLTVTATNASKTYDGLAYSGGNGVTYGGFANGETFANLGGALTYGGTAQGARNAGVYSIAPSGLTSGNYTIAFTNGTLSVGKASLTVSTGPVTKTYDGSLAAAGAALAAGGTQLFGSDSLSGGAFAFTNANEGAGNKTVTVSGVTVNDGNSGNNYLVSYLSNAASTINPAAITVSANNAVKTYDGTTSATDTAALVSGTLYHNASNGGALDGLSGGSFAYTDANAGTGNKTVTVGGVTLNDGNSGGNYTVTYANNTTSTINQASLNFVGTVTERAYDGTLNATLSGYTLTGLIGTQTLGASTTGALFTDKNAGTGKTVNISGITLANGTNGGLASNYHIGATAAATGIIDPKLLMVNAAAADKVYNGNTTATLTSYGLSGFVGSETVVPVFTGTASFADKNVANGKTVTITGITLLNGINGGLAGNYSVAPTATATASITPASLHVAGVVAVDKVYDGTTAAILNTQGSVLTGVIGSDDVHVGSITGSYSTKDVGVNKPIVGISNFVLTGTDAVDYTIVQPSGLTASVTPRSLNVSAVGNNKVYDATTAATATLSDNRVAGDMLNITASDAFTDKNVGNGKYLAVSGITVGGTDAHNYLANTSTATYANITPATLAVSAVGIDKAYNATTNAAATLADTPLGSDVVNLTYSAAAFADKNVGQAKTITVSGIAGSGSDAGNYIIPAVATTSASITPATITQVTGVNAANKVYDGTITATLVTGTLGFVGEFAGDTLTATATSAVFNDKNAGTAKTVTIGGVVLAGPDAGNYVLATTGATVSSADISPRPLTVTATGIDKVYDTTVGATATLADNRIAGDSLTISASDTFLDKNAGKGKFVNVSGITVTGTDAGNYVANASTSTSASILPATLTVVASGADKVYDATTAATVTLSDHVMGSDIVNVNYTSAAFADKNAGSAKDITVNGITGSGADAGNYVLNTVANTTASITPARLTVAATTMGKTYDGNTTATVTLSDNRFSGDLLTITDASAAYANAKPGTGKPVTVNGIAIAGGADQGNYVLEDASVTTTGSITGDVTGGAASLASLPPTVPPTLIPTVAVPAITTVNLALPSTFGGVTVSANRNVVSNASGDASTAALAATGSNSTGSPLGGTGVSGATTASGVASNPAVTVSLVEAATADHAGIVAVSVPEELISAGIGFSFELASNVIEAAANAGGDGAVRVTRMNGKRLPTWLRYVAATHSFSVTSMPAGALPIDVLVRAGSQSWKMVISERGAQ